MCSVRTRKHPYIFEPWTSIRGTKGHACSTNCPRRQRARNQQVGKRGVSRLQRLSSPSSEIGRLSNESTYGSARGGQSIDPSSLFLRIHLAVDCCEYAEEVRKIDSEEEDRTERAATNHHGQAVGPLGQEWTTIDQEHLSTLLVLHRLSQVHSMVSNEHAPTFDSSQ